MRKLTLTQETIRNLNEKQFMFFSDIKTCAPAASCCGVTSCGPDCPLSMATGVCPILNVA